MFLIKICTKFAYFKVNFEVDIEFEHVPKINSENSVSKLL